MRDISIQDILAHLKAADVAAAYQGDMSLRIQGFSSLSHYRKGTFTWVKKQDNWENRPVGVEPLLAFVQQGVSIRCANQIVTEQSKRAFFETIEYFYGQEEQRPAIGQFTYLSPGVKLGKNVRVGHNCTLDGDITIGDNTVIWNGVTLVNRVTIGQDCEIQSGTVIGHDGFNFVENRDHVKTMVRHFGGVTIGDGVTILENCSISRGVIDDTIIENGVKIDADVRVGHNCVIGKNSAFVGGSIIYGSVTFGENAYVATSIIRNQIHVNDNGFVGMGAVVTKDVPPNTTVIGNPAKPFSKAGGTQ